MLLSFHSERKGADATATVKAYFNGKNIDFTVTNDTDWLTAKIDPAIVRTISLCKNVAGYATVDI